MSLEERKAELSFYFPLLQQKPFGKDLKGRYINEVSGLWIYSAIQALRSSSSLNKNLTSLESYFGSSELLIQELKKVVPSDFADLLNEEFLLTRWHSYSTEFAFALASICRRIAGAEHTKDCTGRMIFPEIEELFPLDFLDSIGPLVFKETLLGARVKFKKLQDSSAEIDIRYPLEAIQNIPQWKEIAIDQQEVALQKLLKHFWGINNLSVQLTGKYQNDAKKYYGFEYKLAWKGGEKMQGLLTNQNEYLQKKSLIWFRYLDYIYSNRLGDAAESIQKMRKDYNEQIQLIMGLDQAKRELEGVVSFLLQKKQKAIY